MLYFHLFTSLPHFFPKLPYVLTFPRKYGLVSQFLCFRIKIRPLPICLTIILQLQRISADKYLRRTDKITKSPLIILQKPLIHRIRRVAGHDQQYRDRVLVTAGSLPVIGQILKNKSLIQRPERCRPFPQIIGRTDDQPVGFTDGIQDLSQTIPADAVTFIFLLLTSKAGDTSGIFLQLKQVKPRHCRADRRRGKASHTQNHLPISVAENTGYRPCRFGRLGSAAAYFAVVSPPWRKMTQMKTGFLIRQQL